jgi:hypothetical protein
MIGFIINSLNILREGGDGMSEQQLEEKTSFDGKKVKVIGATYEEGKPEGVYDWRKKLQSREEMLKYLNVGVR